MLALLMLPAASLKTKTTMETKATMESRAKMEAKLTAKFRAKLILHMSERPVMQIVRMLKDTKEELKAEMEDDAKVHEEIYCWCKANDLEKSTDIGNGKRESTRLTSIIDTQKAKIAELTETREATYREVQADKESLQTARNLRLKDNQEFHQQEKDLLEAVKAAHGALVVLSEQNKPDLAQIRSKVLRLIDTKLVHNSKGTLKESANMLSSFMQSSDAAMLLQRDSRPGYQSYAPQSAQVFGILKQMKEDFEQSLAELRDSEAKSVADFEAVKKSKTLEIQLGEQGVIKMDAALANSMQTKSSAETDLESTSDQLKLDLTFMENLKKKCGADYEEYDVRKASRLEEIKAVDAAIKILNSDESFEIFEKMQPTSENLVPLAPTTTGTTTTTADPLLSGGTFLQLSSTSASRSATTMRARLRRQAVHLLQQAAARTGSKLLAKIAASARVDGFDKVKEEIDKMMKHLRQQQKDEAVDKDECIKHLNTNTREIAAVTDDYNDLTAKKDVLEQDIDQLNDQMEEEKSEIANTQKSMKEQTEAREAAKAEVDQTLADHRLMSMILQKAIDRMKQVYLDQPEFLQRQQPGGPHVQTEATATDPGNGPASFKRYEAGRGGQCVQMMENVLAHTKGVEKLAMKDEENDQAGYEEFMKDANRIIKAATLSMTHIKEQLAMKREKLSITNGDLKDTGDEGKRLDAIKTDLHANCDYITRNFDMRQSARQQEVDALSEAKAILSGAN